MKTSPIEKAMADIDLSSRTNEDSNSIVHGRWVGIGACNDIITTLANELADEYALSEDGVAIRGLMADKDKLNEILLLRDKEITDLEFTLHEKEKSLQASRRNYQQKLETDKELSYNYEKSKIVIEYLEEQNRQLVSSLHHCRKTLEGGRKECIN